MLALLRSPRLRSGPAGPEGGPTTGEGPVGVPAGSLLDLGPEGAPVGDTALCAPLLGALFVWIGAGWNPGMREGCIGGPSAAGVEGCGDGTCRSLNGGCSLRLGKSLSVLAGAGEGAAGSFLVCMFDPGAVKLRPPLPAGPLDARGPDGVSGAGALLGPFSRP
jgi:hypothetical protein